VRDHVGTDRREQEEVAAAVTGAPLDLEAGLGRCVVRPRSICTAVTTVAVSADGRPGMSVIADAVSDGGETPASFRASTTYR
jgi:hypothetical protein